MQSLAWAGAGGRGDQAVAQAGGALPTQRPLVGAPGLEVAPNRAAFVTLRGLPGLRLCDRGQSHFAWLGLSFLFCKRGK